MDNWNKIESVPTVDALIKEDLDIETIAVEPIVEEVPTLTTELKVKPSYARPVKKQDDLIDLYSSKSFVGIPKGYSKVDKTLAQELLKNKNVRLATEEEIKEYLNK